MKNQIIQIEKKKESKKLKKIPKTTVTIVWESLPKHKNKSNSTINHYFFFCLERGTGKIMEEKKAQGKLFDGGGVPKSQ